MTSLYDFHLFTRLPYELRLKVWECAIPEARVVPVRYNRQHKRYTTDVSPPVLLHVCTQSRRLFLSKYENFKLSPKFESSIFVDFSRDTLFFDDLDCSPVGDLALDLARSSQSRKIMYCAVESQVWDILRVFRFDNMSEIKLLPNLRTFALVLRQDYDRGLRQTRTLQDGRETVHVEVASTESDIQHTQFNVESIRRELENEVDPKWEAGRPPNIQLWIR